MEALTDLQKETLRQLVQHVRDGKLTEEFIVGFPMGPPGTHAIISMNGNDFTLEGLEITPGIFEALDRAKMLSCRRSSPGVTCVLHGRAFEAVDTNFQAIFPADQSKMLIHVSEGGKVDIGDKHIQGDNIEISGGTVERIETGDKFYDQAQQLIQTVNAQSPQEDIVKVLAAIQEGLTKLELPEAVKEEALNEVKGAEIQVKKEKPDKPKLVERLKNAQNVLTGMENLGMKAIAIGNLLVKAIEWAEQLLT